MDIRFINRVRTESESGFDYWISPKYTCVCVCVWWQRVEEVTQVTRRRRCTLVWRSPWSSSSSSSSSLSVYFDAVCLASSVSSTYTCYGFICNLLQRAIVASKNCRARCMRQLHTKPQHYWGLLNSLMSCFHRPHTVLSCHFLYCSFLVAPLAHCEARLT